MIVVPGQQSTNDEPKYKINAENAIAQTGKTTKHKEDIVDVQTVAKSRS